MVGTVGRVWVTVFSVGGRVGSVLLLVTIAFVVAEVLLVAPVVGVVVLDPRVVEVADSVESVVDFVVIVFVLVCVVDSVVVVEGRVGTVGRNDVDEVGVVVVDGVLVLMDVVGVVVVVVVVGARVLAPVPFAASHRTFTGDSPVKKRFY